MRDHQGDDREEPQADARHLGRRLERARPSWPKSRRSRRAPSLTTPARCTRSTAGRLGRARPPPPWASFALIRLGTLDPHRRYTVLWYPEQRLGRAGVHGLGEAPERLLRHLRALGRATTSFRSRSADTTAAARRSCRRSRRSCTCAAARRGSALVAAVVIAVRRPRSPGSPTPAASHANLARRRRRLRHRDPARRLPRGARLHGALLGGPLPAGVGRVALLRRRASGSGPPACSPASRSPRASPGSRSIPALLILAWPLGPPARRRSCSRRSLGLPLAALVAVAAYYQHAVGDSLAFVHAKGQWGRHVAPLGPLEAAWMSAKAAYHGVVGLARCASRRSAGEPLPATTSIDFVVLVAAVALTVVVFRRLGVAWGVVLRPVCSRSPRRRRSPTAARSCRASRRYVIVDFPLFIAGASLLQGRSTRRAVTRRRSHRSRRACRAWPSPGSCGSPDTPRARLISLG